MPTHIFYLDDEISFCNVFKLFLENEGFTVSTFTCAQKAIDAASSNPPDIFFIDYRLANTTGDIVAEKISESIPKVLVTGELHDPNIPHFLKVFKKPYSLMEVKEYLNNFFNAENS